MSVELDVDAACEVGFFNFDSLEEKSESQSSSFPDSIFVPPYYPTQFSNMVSLNLQTEESQKTHVLVAGRLENKLVKSGNTDNDRGCRAEDFIILCGHKEKGTIEHETDDNGNSRTTASGSFKYENGDYYVEGEVWVKQSNENGQSKTEGGAEVKGGKKF